MLQRGWGNTSHNLWVPVYLVLSRGTHHSVMPKNSVVALKQRALQNCWAFRNRDCISTDVIMLFFTKYTIFHKTHHFSLGGLYRRSSLSVEKTVQPLWSLFMFVFCIEKVQNAFPWSHRFGTPACSRVKKPVSCLTKGHQLQNANPGYFFKMKMPRLLPFSPLSGMHVCSASKAATWEGKEHRGLGASYELD